QVVNVLIKRVTRIDPVLHAVETSQQHRRKCEIRIARRIGWTKLEPLQFRIRREHRNANRRRTITRRVREIHRRLETRYETFVAVRRRRRKSHDRRRVFQQSTDVVACEIRESCIAVAGEERFLTLPKRLVTVHPRTVIAKQWLRHKRRGLSKLVRSIANYVFEYLEIVGRSQHRGVAKVDFTLTRGRYFMVMAFDSDATFTERQRDLGAQVDQRVSWRAGDITFLRTNSIAEVRTRKLVCVTTTVPVCFIGIDSKTRRMLVVMKLD